MNRKSDENAVEQPSSHRSVGTVLQFVPRAEREQHTTELKVAQKLAVERKFQKPPRDVDDYDPGPTAA